MLVLIGAMNPVRGEDQILYLLHEGARHPVALTRFKGVWVDQPCAARHAKKENCFAASGVLGQLPAKKLTREQLRAPLGAATCRKMGAEPLTLLDARSEQYAYCRFRDDSVLDVWALLQRGKK